MSSKLHPILEIFLFRNEWQLATEDAIYSDGSRYRPLVKAFAKIEQSFSNNTRMLVLGAGLGSAISVLKKKGFCLKITLVDNDEEIIRLNKDWRWKETAKAMFLHEDAQQFIKTDAQQYDVVVVDVFKDRIVPTFVSEHIFLQQCHDKTISGGKVIINYIINNEMRWKQMEANFKLVFPRNEVVCFGINRVMIATV